MRRAADLKLFQDRDKNWVTYGELVQAMRDVKADDCDVLLVHTDLSFGLPTRELKRKELVAVLYDAICELGVKTLVFPTFTFSYGNREDYDVKNTKCKMGMALCQLGTEKHDSRILCVVKTIKKAALTQ